MYKLVIVEDERDARDRLADLIAKSGGNFEIASVYETGIDAYEGILSDNPDLILTDIRIPYINGIELAKKVREVFPLIKIIIITGYNEFDYAKEAANLGVAGFISKPITLENIRALLDKAEAELDDEFLTASSLSELSHFYQSSLPVIRENDLYRLSNMQAVTPAFEKKLNDNDISLDYPYFVMCIFDFDETAEEDGDRYDIAFSSVRQLIGEDIGSLWDHETFNRYEKLCMLIKAKTHPDVKDLERRLENAIQRIGRYSGMPVSAGISRVYHNNRNFAAMVREAVRALEYRSVMGGRKVFFFGYDAPPAIKLTVNDGAIRELGYILHSRSAGDCVDRIDAVRRNLGNSRDSLYYVAISILNVLIKACDDLEGLYGMYGAPDAPYRRLLELKTDDEIFDYLKELARAVKNLNDSLLVDNVERNLRKVVSYMEAHFCDPELNFESLAGEMNFSVSYISALLKKKTGLSFVKMLTGLRMEKARELLLNPSLKIIDVAEQLGYNDSYYFSHCFKKHTGMSPKEYRNSKQDE